ncbi:hypothetical protein DLAC_06745 [Tieghemostelium lacteum]|uniref:Transmembrane protein n=1 Tax=Tieghemostelium lacteum TaxID=361077 RepID=A0A151ZFJ0_TIELA|nr:hypothetical protein DLAC_06745 [Tieghemostelium lacteum]|eukprot:KYQ92741.1 hypothetical protein DLAC_06745 [Tieghemostelium lacteum]
MNSDNSKQYRRDYSSVINTIILLMSISTIIYFYSIHFDLKGTSNPLTKVNNQTNNEVHSDFKLEKLKLNITIECHYRPIYKQGFIMFRLVYCDYKSPIDSRLKPIYHYSPIQQWYHIIIDCFYDFINILLHLIQMLLDYIFYGYEMEINEAIYPENYVFSSLKFDLQQQCMSTSETIIIQPIDTMADKTTLELPPIEDNNCTLYRYPYMKLIKPIIPNLQQLERDSTISKSMSK